MAESRWTLEAERWLHEIHSYIAADNPRAANRMMDRILEKAATLSAFPETGYRYGKRKDIHIRILLYGHYRIAYRIKEGGDIDILGVFHGALEIDRFLM